MKKLLALVAVAALATTTLVGCKSDKETEVKEITIAQNKLEIDAQLKAYAKKFEESTGIKVNVVSCGGDSCSLGEQLKADYQKGEMPDIFTIDGVGSYNEWKDIILDLTGEKWNQDTDVAFKQDGKVYGFPVAIEGWGMAYNADMLAKAGIDPKTLNNYDGYKAAFEKLDGMKAELGIDSVVSMAAGNGMEWVTSHHNFNSYLSNGQTYGDLTITNEFLKGNVDATRFQEYADWVALLFKYADKGVLTTGDYNAQVNAFANSKAVFLHQGNWTDGNMKQAFDGGATKFNMAFAPHGSQKAVTDGIFVGAPSYYVVNSESKAAKAAKQFLESLVYTEAGNDYMVNQAGMIPAFKNITLKPTLPLSQSVQAWAAEGKVYSWNQYFVADEFRGKTLGPIYLQLAKGDIDEAKFIELFTAAAKEQ